MENENNIHSSLSADKNELRRTLKDLREQEISLKNQIYEIKYSKGSSFNPLEYYQEHLQNIRALMINIRFYIKKSPAI